MINDGSGGIAMEYLLIAGKLIFIYFVILTAVRLMGKRAAGELTVFDFVVIVGMGDVMMHVTVNRGYGEGLVILATLVFLERVLARLCAKNIRLARIIEGEPTLIIKNGKLLVKNMEKENINLMDLYQELRDHGIDDINKVKKAVLEACGKFSVIEKDESDQLNTELARLTEKIDQLQQLLEKHFPPTAITGETKEGPDRRQ